MRSGMGAKFTAARPAPRPARRSQALPACRCIASGAVVLIRSLPSAMAASSFAARLARPAASALKSNTTLKLSSIRGSSAGNIIAFGEGRQHPALSRWERKLYSADRGNWGPPVRLVGNDPENMYVAGDAGTVFRCSGKTSRCTPA